VCVCVCRGVRPRVVDGAQRGERTRAFHVRMSPPARHHRGHRIFITNTYNVVRARSNYVEKFSRAALAAATVEGVSAAPCERVVPVGSLPAACHPLPLGARIGGGWQPRASQPAICCRRLCYGRRARPTAVMSLRSACTPPHPVVVGLQPSRNRRFHVLVMRI